MGGKAYRANTKRKATCDYFLWAGSPKPVFIRVYLYQTYIWHLTAPNQPPLRWHLTGKSSLSANEKDFFFMVLGLRQRQRSPRNPQPAHFQVASEALAHGPRPRVLHRADKKGWCRTVAISAFASVLCFFWCLEMHV